MDRTFYHGISSTQRGGNALEKLKKIIHSGVVYPAGSELDPTQELHAEVFHYAVRHGFRNGEISIGQFVKQHASDTQFLSLPMVKKYNSDPKFRGAVEKFGLDTISYDDAVRELATWGSTNEAETRGGYGQEIYLEAKAPESDEVILGEDVLVTRPVPLNKVSRIVLSGRYKGHLNEIQAMLHAKAPNVRVEVRKGKTLEHTLLSVASTVLLGGVLIFFSRITGFAISDNLLNSGLSFPLSFIIIFAMTYVLIKKFRN